MATKKGKIKQKDNNGNINVLYPETTIDQVVNLQAALNSKSEKIEIVDLTNINSGN